MEVAIYPIEWHKIATLSYGSINDVASGLGIHILINSSYIVVSNDDGNSWTSYNNPDKMSRIHFVHDRFFIWDGDYTYNRFKYSFDGVSWVEGTASDNNSWEIYDFGYINGLWFAQLDGNNQMYYSSNLTSWTMVDFSFPSASRAIMISFKDKLYRFSNSNTVSFTSDGMSWTSNSLASSGDFNDIYHVFSSPDYMIVLDWSTEYFIRTHDSIYTELNMPFSEYPTYYGERNCGIFCNGFYILCASTTNNNTVSFFYSSDTINWNLVEKAEDGKFLSPSQLLKGENRILSVISTGVYATEI